MDHTSRFDGKGEIYAKARPKYAAELFGYLKNTMNIGAGSVFADVGSGTEIFAEQLLECGYKVFAVEPNGDMRKKAEEKLSRNENFVSVSGSDRNMNLPDKSVDIVSAAQAFHWFDAEAFGTECARVLKPGGRVMLVYNFRDEEAPCTKALAKLRHKYSPEFRGFSNGVSGEACAALSVGEISVFGADNTQIYDRRVCTARVLSSPYSPKETDAGYTEYLREIHEIFDTFSRDGLIRRADIHGGVHRQNLKGTGGERRRALFEKRPLHPQKLLN